MHQKHRKIEPRSRTEDITGRTQGSLTDETAWPVSSGGPPVSATPHTSRVADVQNRTQLLFMCFKICMCGSMWRCVHMCAIACGDQKMASDPLELEF